MSEPQQPKTVRAIVMDHMRKWWREGKINHNHTLTDAEALIEELAAATQQPNPETNWPNHETPPTKHR